MYFMYNSYILSFILFQASDLKKIVCYIFCIIVIFYQFIIYCCNFNHLNFKRIYVHTYMCVCVCTCVYVYWSRKWQPTPVSLIEKCLKQRSLAWGLKELDMTEQLSMHIYAHIYIPMYIDNIQLTTHIYL